MTEIDKTLDKFFWQLVDSPENSKDFMEKVLPKHIKKQLDFSRIHIESTQFVSNEFKEGYADFTIKIIMKTKKGKKVPANIHFIISIYSYFANITSIEILSHPFPFFIFLFKNKSTIQEFFVKRKLENAKETAKNLLEMGIDIDKIAKATGLSQDEIEKL